MTAPDLTAYRAVHRALRIAPHRMAAAARTTDPLDRRRVRALARYWRGYAGELVAHHTVEDEIFFPVLVDRVPVAARLIERTDAEHASIDERIHACRAATAEVEREPTFWALEQLAVDLDRLAERLDRHLDLEDAEVLPLFERHLTGASYAALEAEAERSLGVGPQAAFTIPFVIGALPRDEARVVLAGAPLSLRVLYRLTSGRHARLESAALGGTTAPEEVAA